MKPFFFRERSNFRLFLGKKFYTTLRYFKWYFGKNKFTKSKDASLMPHVSFKHETPLIRKLKDADMWMHLNKIKNLQIAIKNLNSIVIHPGETFSYWRLIGKPTKRKGYVKGMVLVNGRVESGIGGGLCQLSNLIYWMTLHTPLTVTERFRHSHDVFPDSKRTQPFGSGATCMYNYIDLQIQNNTDSPYQLNTYLTEKNLVGEWRTDEPKDKIYEVYERDQCITHEFWGGYIRHNTIYRKSFSLDKQLICDEYITENHAVMVYKPFLNAVVEEAPTL